MAPVLNWQIGIQQSGHKSYVPVRHLSDATAWGRIGQTQITKGGICPPRVVFIPSDHHPMPEQYLFKLSVLKRAIARVNSVVTPPDLASVMMDEDEKNRMHAEYKAKFFGKLEFYAGLEAGLWGPDIIIGKRHKHFSAHDQKRHAEQKGRYLPLPPIPVNFMTDFFGNPIPWVAPPLSDSRSVGNWKIRYGRFYIGGELGSSDDSTASDDPTSDVVIINRVGHYYLKR